MIKKLEFPPLGAAAEPAQFSEKEEMQLLEGGELSYRDRRLTS
jgi:hypothetical protein